MIQQRLHFISKLFSFKAPKAASTQQPRRKTHQIGSPPPTPQTTSYNSRALAQRNLQMSLEDDILEQEVEQKDIKQQNVKPHPKPLTAKQLLEHPEFPYVTWLLTPTRRERVKVGAGRGGPFRICYEVHGTGPIKLVLIMGLGGLKHAWQRQTKDFGHQQADKYSCLILDNRGIGDSDKPWFRYSTSEMANDVIEVLDHIGWTDRRDLHVVGISMGGMIAQELGLKIPKRIASLSLISTAAQIRNTIGFFENIYNRAMLFVPRSTDSVLNSIKYNLFSDDYLHHSDELEYTVQPFPTNGDRCMAVELHKRTDPGIYPKPSFILQLIAAGWHSKTPAQLRQLATLVGPNRIMVMHGTRDRMVTFPHGVDLLAGLGGEEAGITKIFLEGQGHVIPIEKRKEFNSYLEEIVERTRSMDANDSESDEEEEEVVVVNGKVGNGHVGKK